MAYQSYLSFEGVKITEMHVILSNFHLISSLHAKEKRNSIAEVSIVFPRITVIILMSLFVVSSHANETIPISERVVLVKIANSKERLQLVMENPNVILQNYQPTKAQIRKKKVFANSIEFYAKKTVLFITANVYVRGNLKIEKSDKNCQDGLSYEGEFDFQGSDGLIYESIESLNVQVCILEINQNEAELKITGKMIKSEHYMNPVGSIVRDLIEAQFEPLAEAILESAKLYKL